MVKQLFFNSNYHIILTEKTLKQLNKVDKIKLDSDYVNDYLSTHKNSNWVVNTFGQDIPVATEETITNFANCPIINILKDDMELLTNDIADYISKMHGVAAVEVRRSSSVGMSTYLDVELRHPDYNGKKVKTKLLQDSNFVDYFEEQMTKEFLITFRLSNHLNGHENVHYNINTYNHVFSYFKDKVVHIVGEQLNYIGYAWKTYLNTGQLPEEQTERNKKHEQQEIDKKAEYYEMLKLLTAKVVFTESVNVATVLDYLKYSNADITDIIDDVKYRFEQYNIPTKYLLNVCADCLNENIIEYALTPNFNYSLLYEDVKKCVDENLVTDLKNSGIKISQKAINSIPYNIDIQNSNVQKITISRYQDLKGLFVLLTDGNDVIAIYNKDRFAYNPNKLKMSDVINYDIYEVINNKGSVNDLRNKRQLSRQGYTDLRNTDTTYNKPPKSVRYVLDRDWNAEASKEYYTKLLHQNRLGKYADRLEYAYTVIEDMIQHRRREKTVGKKAVYTDWINKLTGKINTAELQMDALDKNVNIDIPKLIKSLNALDKVVKDASKFIGYEDDAIATFGYTKQRPHAKIER